jgi:ankyrin repeat protein
MANEGDIVLAVRSGNCGELERLLNEGADPNTIDETGSCVLKIAAYTGRSRVAKMLTEKGAEPKFAGFKDMTMSVVLEDSERVAVYLQQDRSSVYETDYSGNTPVVFAILNWNFDMAAKLIEHMEDVDVKNKYGNTPLIIAVERGNLRIVQRLIKKGADVNVRNRCLDTALIYAAGRGYADIVSELIAAGAGVNVRNKYEDTPIIHAALSGNSTVIRKLVVAGADVNNRGFWGKTPLMIASLKGHSEAVRELISLGADIDTQDRFGYTALMEAVGEVNVDVIRSLIDKWEKSGHTHTQHSVPVDVVKEGYVETVKELLGAGADAKTPDKNGNTAFELARDEEMRRLLGDKRHEKRSGEDEM